MGLLPPEWSLGDTQGQMFAQKPGVRQHTWSHCGVCLLPHPDRSGPSKGHTLGQEGVMRVPGVRARLHPGLLHPRGEHRHQTRLFAGGF